MVLGVGTYPNGAKFNFPRSYIPTFDVLVDADDVMDSGGHITFSDPLNPNVQFHIVIWENFYEWTSNKYTIDFVIEESYYQILPAPTLNPMPFTLVFSPTSPGVNGLVFIPFSLGFTQHNVLLLPGPPPDYWTPIPS